jgi:hypothetical protein
MDTSFFIRDVFLESCSLHNNEFPINLKAAIKYTGAGAAQSV